MPTITLTIDDATLDAMTRGEAVQLQAVLRVKKPKAKADLPPEHEALRKDVADLLHEAGATQHIAKVWKDIASKLLPREHPDDIMDTLACCVDWSEGGDGKPLAFFVADYAAWCERSAMPMMDAEPLRDAWRKARGLR